MSFMEKEKEFEGFVDIIASELGGKSSEEIKNKLMMWSEDSEFFNKETKEGYRQGIESMGIISQM